MTNPWLALDVGTSSNLRARDLRSARERFLADASVEPGVRAPIAESWQRSAAVGLDPALTAVPIELSEDEARERLREHPLGPFAPLLRESLGAVSGGSEYLIALADADGLVLAVEGDERMRREAASRMGFVPGARFEETVAGTNAMGTALATGRAVQVFAAEHFCEHSQWWTCAAAPIRDWATGRVLGAVNVTGPMESVHPHSLALVAATAALFETSSRLVGSGVEGPVPTPRRDVAPAIEPSSNTIAALPPLAKSSGVPHLELNLLGTDRADARLDGQPIHLSLRHSELLALLATHPNGMTAEQLALQLYGDHGKPVTVRAELSRLRQVVPACVDADPYRLIATADTDLAAIQQLLHDGKAREAAQRYTGRLLPRSEAPGIAELRDELEGWMRRSVLAADDADTLWPWLATPSGEEDIHAWKRFLANLPHEDGRRGLAGARLERLRVLLATP
jgi:GAF domain-containing protein